MKTKKEKKTRKAKKEAATKSAPAATPNLKPRLTAEQIATAPTSLRQASIQRSVREKVNRIILTQIGGAEAPKFYPWTWAQRDEFMGKDTPESKVVKARYEAHLATIKS